MQKVIIMKRYTQEERDAIIEEIEAQPIDPDEWEGPHDTKIVSFKYVDDTPHKGKKGLTAFFDRIKAIIHPA